MLSCRHHGCITVIFITLITSCHMLGGCILHLDGLVALRACRNNCVVIGHRLFTEHLLEALIRIYVMGILVDPHVLADAKKTQKFWLLL